MATPKKTYPTNRRSRTTRLATAPRMNPDGTVGIPLTAGKWATIDAADLPFAARHRWSYDDRYAVTTIGGKKRYLHRELLVPTGDLQVDHINDDKLDNRRSNLRAVTQRQNIRAKALKNGASRYFGIAKEGKRWRVRIRRGQTRFDGGFHTCEVQAALVAQHLDAVLDALGEAQAAAISTRLTDAHLAAMSETLRRAGETQ